MPSIAKQSNELIVYLKMKYFLNMYFLLVSLIWILTHDDRDKEQKQLVILKEEKLSF